ncbi:DUF3325 domain-containing protein [Xanthomonas campestris pv. raphani]|nr:DUF3325 domain-containing protein [Xanthomonas campestris]MEA9728438.1 DUF3325 domain-containing protein [Xanthomonas campestris pv. raphani]
MDVPCAQRVADVAVDARRAGRAGRHRLGAAGQCMAGMIASLTALALCHAGMMAICVAMHRHYEQLTGQRTAPRAQRWQLRVLGACLLLSALGVCVRAWGGSAGAVLWLGMASAGALWVALGLAYAPRRSVWVAVTVGCLGGVAAAGAVLGLG